MLRVSLLRIAFSLLSSGIQHSCYSTQIPELYGEYNLPLYYAEGQLVRSDLQSQCSATTEYISQARSIRRATRQIIISIINCVEDLHAW